ncbi:uncharacterized protein ARMOST_04274 [Armillaria ostoyae]|uniref:Uncharacterized protein n=1 Tax=Armillaria ostoyae TaxID=47428 RepID=A0A284QWW6_ARMOS|nr:uncharacterized protein ARMOST_04274 [Armillaria ostoyae]
MFHFYTGTLGIWAIYQPGSEKGVDAPLGSGESWTIGYDTKQVKAISRTPEQFFVQEGQDVGVGFLKLFLSTEYLDLLAIIQEPLVDYDQSVPPSVAEIPSSCHTMCVPLVAKWVEGVW